MVSSNSTMAGLGRRALARLWVTVLIALAVPQPAFAQRRQAPASARPPAAQPAAGRAPSAVPIPDQRSSLRLLWSTMAAVDHANRTGNYSVLRDLGTGGFQANNNPATLAAVFSGVRAQNIELDEVLTVTPVWEIPPTIVRTATIRMRGSFRLRPSTILFDLLFSWERGGWRLDGVAVQATPATQ